MFIRIQVKIPHCSLQCKHNLSIFLHCPYFLIFACCLRWFIGQSVIMSVDAYMDPYEAVLLKHGQEFQSNVS